MLQDIIIIIINKFAPCKADQTGNVLQRFYTRIAAFLRRKIANGTFTKHLVPHPRLFIQMRIGMNNNIKIQQNIV